MCSAPEKLIIKSDRKVGAGGVAKRAHGDRNVMEPRVGAQRSPSPSAGTGSRPAPRGRVAFRGGSGQCQVDGSSASIDCGLCFPLSPEQAEGWRGVGPGRLPLTAVTQKAGDGGWRPGSVCLFVGLAPRRGSGGRSGFRPALKALAAWAAAYSEDQFE